MCLAVPGRIIDISSVDDSAIARTGVIDFGGSTLEVGLDMVPEAGIGDWVLVHAGYAIQQMEEAEANEVWDYLRQMDEELPTG